MPRPEGEAFVDHDSGQIRVKHSRAERVLKAADNNRLIDERVQWSAKATPFRSKTWPASCWRTGHDQHFEIGSM
jgi:hypothetical protein